MKKILLALCTLTFCASSLAQTGIITTLAGLGPSYAGFTGDGGPATAAEVGAPEGVCVDRSGNIYLTASDACVIRKIDAAGIITTIAGTASTTGFAGDGGPATAAKFYYPSGLAVDTAGNIFVADTHNNRIRKISTSGIITTIAGTGTAGYNGDSIAATTAMINAPNDVTTDRFGNVYVCDASNNRIRKIDRYGMITTVAGSSGSGFHGDGGQATAATLTLPAGIYIDKTGNMFISDSYNNRVRKVDTSGIITTYAGGAGGACGDSIMATASCFLQATGITGDSCGNIYLSDPSHYSIRKITPGGMIYTVAGHGDRSYYGDGGPATAAGMESIGLCFDHANNLLMADAYNNVLRKVTFNHSSISAITGNSSLCVASTTRLRDSTLLGSWSSAATSIATVDTAGVVTGVSTGTTTITYTVSNACSNTPFVIDTQVVNVIVGVPHLTPVEGPGIVCIGAPTTLIDYTPGGTWTSGTRTVATVDSVTGIVSAVSAGSSIITYTVTNSCGATIDTQLITVPAAPATGTITGAAKLCETDSITLANATAGGVWTSGNTSVATVTGTGIVIGLTAGNAVISYTVSNYCSYRSTTHNIHVNIIDSCYTTNSVSTVANPSQEISIYPNPNSGNFTIHFLTPAEYAEITITDLLGRMVETRHLQGFTERSEQISLPGAVPGLYFVRISTNHSGISKAITIN